MKNTHGGARAGSGRKNMDKVAKTYKLKKELITKLEMIYPEKTMTQKIEEAIHEYISKN